MIRFECSHCGMKFKVKPEYAGRSSQCPTCKQPVTVPGLDQTQVKMPAGEVDGPPSSLARAGVEAGGVTLQPERQPGGAGPPSAQRAVQRMKSKQRYVIEGEIARGGMGAVLRAFDGDLRREVAIKFMLDPKDRCKKTRFIEEAQITGQLEHPNIPPIHELGVDAQERLFFSMKIIKGRSLAQVFELLRQPRGERREPRGSDVEAAYPLTRLLTVFVSVCNGLAYAHSRGVIHRDLKPANIMLGDFGEVYVMDWGLAKVRRPEAGGRRPESPFSRDPKGSGGGEPSKVCTDRALDSDLTQEGAVLGTPAYMPPEQADGRLQDIDQRSDVYSLGAILYEMLTLQPPVDKDGGYLAVLLRVVQGEIVPPEVRATASSRNPARRIPKELSAIAMKALAKDTADRYQSVEALRQDIERYLEGRSVSAKEDTVREAVWKLVKRNLAVSAVTAAATLLVMFVLARSWWVNYQALQAVEKEKQTRQAQNKTSAPLFLRDARTSAQRGQLDYALTQAGVALDFDPDLADAYLLKGQLLIVQKDLPAARAALDQYLRQRSDDKDAAELARLCTQVRSDDPSGLTRFVAIFERQRAFTLAERLEQNSGRLLELYRKRIESAFPGWGNRLTVGADSRLRLDFEGQPQLTDLTPLQGMPLSELSLVRCRIKDLSPLQGMPLTWLSLVSCTQINDLSPLQGLPLTYLNLFDCSQIRDLGPLHGMPLRTLNLGTCRQVADLTPLQGMPLLYLTLTGCPIKDLSPLLGMPLISLELAHCIHVKDLSPLQKMPLTALNLYNCTEVKDLTPLAGLKLKELHLPPQVEKGMASLRKVTTLENIFVIGRFPAAEFWKQYDAGAFKGTYGP